MNEFPPIAYKVLTAKQWADWQAQGSFDGAPVDLADGYIHMSASGQLTETVERHFTGQTGLCIAAVDLAVLGNAVRWEPSRGGQLFPHAYCSLPRSAVIAHGPLERDQTGMVRLPYPA